MTQPASPATAAQPSDRATIGRRLRGAATAALFDIVLLVPTILRLRRNENSWLIFRIGLGLAGAALVVVPLGVWNNWILSIAGLAMFLAAALLPPVKPEPNVDDKARELGAFGVLNGGALHAKNIQSNDTRIFLGPEILSVLDAGLHLLLSIPAAQIRCARAVPRDGCWYLQVDWAENSVEFSYRGFFAEHLARVAESSLNGLRLAQLPILQPEPEHKRGRAAGA